MATGILNNSRSRLQAGFTLLELVAVLFIIAILSGGLILSLGSVGPERHLEEEARRLTMAVTHAAQDTILDTRPRGLLVNGAGYRFVLLRAEGWSAPSLDDAFWKPHLLPRGFRLELNGEEPMGDLSKGLESDGDKRKDETLSDQDSWRDRKGESLFAKEKSTFKRQSAAPQIIFSASGEITPFVMNLRIDSRTAYAIRPAAYGKVEMIKLVE